MEEKSFISYKISIIYLSHFIILLSFGKSLYKLGLYFSSIFIQFLILILLLVDISFFFYSQSFNLYKFINLTHSFSLLKLYLWGCVWKINIIFIRIKKCSRPIGKKRRKQESLVGRGLKNNIILWSPLIRIRERKSVTSKRL